MKKIIILGNSIAGAKAIEEIRVNDKESEITLFPFEERCAYDRDLLAGYLAESISLSECLWKPTEYYEQQNVQIIREKKIARINFRKKQVTAQREDEENKQKEVFPFDELIIASVADYKFPDIKGTNKAGVFAINTIDAVDKIMKQLPLVDVITIQSDSRAGLDMARAIEKRGKEVFLIVPGLKIKSEDLNTEASEEDTKDEPSEQTLEASGGLKNQIIGGNEITEVLGDSDVKAVRLKSGKVMAADIVIFTDVSPNFKLFMDTPLKINRKICVNAAFQTNVEGVYALDGVCEREGALKLINNEPQLLDLYYQGWAVAQNITAAPASVESEGLDSEQEAQNQGESLQSTEGITVGEVEPPEQL